MAKVDVDYGKVQLDFSSIMVNLHLGAMKVATEGTGISASNDLFTEDDPPKFKGSTEARFFMMPVDGQPVNKADHNKYLKVVRDYFGFMTGDEMDAEIRYEDLEPITRVSAETSASISATPPPLSGTSTTSESLYISQQARSVDRDVQFLFEATPPVSATPPPASPDDKEGRELIGYAYFYGMKLANQNLIPWRQKAKRKLAGIFGGFIADLRNLELRTTAGNLNFGRIFDPTWLKSKVGVVDIDKDTVDNFVKRAIAEDKDVGEGNSIQVSVQTVSRLIQVLNKNQGLEEDAIKKLQDSKAVYAVVLEFETIDPLYKKYTKEKVAEWCTTAFGTAMGMLNTNKVTKDDVIYVQDFKTPQKRRSNFEVLPRNRGNPSTFSAYDSTDSYYGGKSSTTKESVEVPTFTESAVRGLIETLFEDPIIGGSVILDESARQFLAEGHANEYIDCKRELRAVGAVNLNRNVQLLRSEYEKAINSMFKPDPWGKVSKKSEVVLPKALAAHTENAKGYVDLLKRAYIKGSSANTLVKGFIDKLQGTAGKGKGATKDTKPISTIDGVIEAFDAYIGAPDYKDPRTVECYALLQALKKLPHMAPIDVSFQVPENPADQTKLKEVKKASKVPGTFELSDYPLESSIPKFEGWRFLSAWTPDPNSLASNGMVSSAYEPISSGTPQPPPTPPPISDDVPPQPPPGPQPTPSGDNLISVLFRYRDQNNQLMNLDFRVGKPGDIDDESVKLPQSMGGYTLSGWNPDPDLLGTGRLANEDRFRISPSDVPASFLANVSSNVAESLYMDGVHMLYESLFTEATSSSTPLPIFAVTALTSISAVSSLVSVDFMYVDPLSVNATARKVGETLAAPKGRFNPADYPDQSNQEMKDIIARLRKSFAFHGWTPDPNKLDASSAVWQVSSDWLELSSSNANRWDAFIVPHKRIVSKNRQNAVARGNDGTIKAKPSNEPWKPDDIGT